MRGEGRGKQVYGASAREVETCKCGRCEVHKLGGTRGDQLDGPLGGRDAAFDGGVLRRQTKGIPANWVHDLRQPRRGGV